MPSKRRHIFIEVYFWFIFKPLTLSSQGIFILIDKEVAIRMNQKAGCLITLSIFLNRAFS
jgi:hypothetical protein